MERLPEPEIAERLQALGPGWRREGEALVSDRECADFAAAIALVNRIANEAERVNHHPDILVHGYNKLRITVTTHTAGGLTDNDFALATTLDSL